MHPRRRNARRVGVRAAGSVEVRAGVGRDAVLPWLLRRHSAEMAVRARALDAIGFLGNRVVGCVCASWPTRTLMIFSRPSAEPCSEPGTRSRGGFCRGHRTPLAPGQFPCFGRAIELAFEPAARPGSHGSSLAHRCCWATAQYSYHPAGSGRSTVRCCHMGRRGVHRRRRSVLFRIAGKTGGMDRSHGRALWRVRRDRHRSFDADWATCFASNRVRVQGRSPLAVPCWEPWFPWRLESHDSETSFLPSRGWFLPVGSSASSRA